MPFHFGSYNLSHSKRLMNNVKKQIGDFHNYSVSYTDTDSFYIHTKYWCSSNDNGFVGKPLELGKKDYGNSGVFYAWFLAPKINYF